MTKRIEAQSGNIEVSPVDGSVFLNFENASSLETDPFGISVYGSDPAPGDPFNGVAQEVLVSFKNQNEDLVGEIGWNNDTELRIASFLESGNIELWGQSAGVGGFQEMLKLNPDAGHQSYYNGTLILQLENGQLNLTGGTAGNAARYQLVDDPTAPTVRASIGFESGDVLIVRNAVDGAAVNILASDTGGTDRTILSADPDAVTTLRAATDLVLENAGGNSAIVATAANDVALFFDTSEVARTLSSINGGFEVNNTLTGAGFERVMTTSDVPTGLPASGTTTDSTLRWDGSNWAEETRVRISDAGVLTILDAAETDSVTFYHDGTNLLSDFTNTTEWVLDGSFIQFVVSNQGRLVVRGTGGIGQMSLHHDGDAQFNTSGKYLFNSSATTKEMDLRTGMRFSLWNQINGNRLYMQYSSNFGLIATTAGKIEFSPGSSLGNEPLIIQTNRVDVDNGASLRIYDSSTTFFVQFAHNGTDLETTFNGTTADWNIRDLTGLIRSDHNFAILESAAALADEAGYGQLWIRNDAPNMLAFTDDTGQDILISPYRATVQTTDATQTEIISIAVASGTGFGFRINIIGTEDSTGDTVFESVFGAIRNQGGTTALVGSSITDRTDDAGASTWVITVAADDTTDALTVDVTGEASHTVDWKVSVEILDV